jgi:D-glycero-alpha-D-manno-heptose 1-phosphate guanylyltransferase
MLDKSADLVVLAGGNATRMGLLCEGLPKALLPVAGVPFLIWQLKALARWYNLRRVVICARQGTEPMFRNYDRITAYTFDIIEELRPLGTGGAILHAMEKRPLSDPFLAINGDVLFRMDTPGLLDMAAFRGAALAAVTVPDAGRFGTVQVQDGMINGFAEKTGLASPGLINTGLYAFSHKVLSSFSGPASFEYDIAPVLCRRGQLGAVCIESPFIDIGTPESYAMADHVARLMDVA